MPGRLSMILHHEFIRKAKKYSKKMAIIDLTTQRRVTYGRALIGSIILAKKFKTFKDGYIGVMIPNSAGSYLSILGILMAGKIPVMINYSTGAAENCEYAQFMCNFKTIITSRAFLEKTRSPLVPGMIFIEDIMNGITVGDKIGAALRSKGSAKRIIKKYESVEPDDDAVILFTSGSEKEPKAVELTHKNLASNLAVEIDIMKLSDRDAIFAVLPLFHVFGHNTNFWLPLVLGGAAITYANPLDYKKIPSLIKQEKPTLIAGTPVFLAGYLRESQPGDFASLRLVIAGADKTPNWLREEYREKHNIELMEGYGCTETSPVISVNTPEANRPGSIGKPLPNLQVKITDINTGKTLGPELEGKIMVRGDSIMKGYFDNIEETSLRIKDGWYDTGDMGMLDEDGYLWHKGRLKRFAKVGGEMVSLVKTESVLEEILPEQADCCVVEVPDTRKGAMIIAVVTKEVNQQEIKKKMAAKLAPIGIPKQFLVIPELPKMGSGKVDFRSVSKIVRDELGTSDLE